MDSSIKLIESPEDSPWEEALPKIVVLLTVSAHDIMESNVIKPNHYHPRFISYHPVSQNASIDNTFISDTLLWYAIHRPPIYVLIFILTCLYRQHGHEQATMPSCAKTNYATVSSSPL